MSIRDYELSQHIAGQLYTFHSLVLAAMRRADGENLERLKTAFPSAWEELKARYNAPGGILPGDPERCAHCQQYH